MSTNYRKNKRDNGDRETDSNDFTQKTSGEN